MANAFLCSKKKKSAYSRVAIIYLPEDSVSAFMFKSLTHLLCVFCEEEPEDDSPPSHMFTLLF